MTVYNLVNGRTARSSAPQVISDDFVALEYDFDPDYGKLSASASVTVEVNNGSSWKALDAVSLSYLNQEYQNILPITSGASVRAIITPIDGIVSVKLKTASDIRSSEQEKTEGVINVDEYGASGDGSTDDTSALQAAIDAAPAGSTLEVPAGTYIVSRVDPGTTNYCLNINKSLHLHIHAGATIKLADGDITNATDPAYMIYITASNVYVSGFGKLDMNKSGQTDSTIGPNINSRIGIFADGALDNLAIKDIEIYDALGNGIYLNGDDATTGVMTNVSITNTRVNLAREGILFHWANNVRCTNNTLFCDNSTGAQDAIEVSECDNFIVNNNYIQGALGSGVDIFAAGEQCTCNGNVIVECGNGIAVGNTSGTGPSSVTVAGNVIESPLTTFGISVTTGVGADRVIIDGNIIRDAQSQHCIDIRTGSNISVINNLMDTTSIGDGVINFVDGTLISGNNIFNIGGSGKGIRNDGDNCTISNNKMLTIGGDGIELNGANNFVNGNNLSAEIIDDNGTSNIKINNNVTTSGLDNTGATTPIDHDNIIGGVWTV